MFFALTHHLTTTLHNVWVYRCFAIIAEFKKGDENMFHVGHRAKQRQSQLYVLILRAINTKKCNYYLVLSVISLLMRRLSARGGFWYLSLKAQLLYTMTH